MEKRKLRLIAAGRNGGTSAASSAIVLLFGLLFGAAGIVASASGADLARRNFDPREVAESALQQAFLQGAGNVVVEEKILSLRRTIGRRPLDSRTRVVYAALQLSLSSSAADLASPAFHAAVAARLAPVTVPIVRVAALVMASTHRTDEAASLIREMFEYDPDSAARLLGQAARLFDTATVTNAVPQAPLAWLAWSRELERQGRHQESLDWLERGLRRWPDHLPILKSVAAKLAKSEDSDALAALIPEDFEIPEDPAAAALFAYRARAKGTNDDIDGAMRDLERALALDGDDFNVRMLAAASYEMLGLSEESRHHWNAALFSLPPGARQERRQVLLRLARLEDRHGKPAAALRRWRQLLEIDPDHEEAKRRIAALTGA